LDEAAEALIKAVQAHDARTAHKLLEEAGGACQARDLARNAKENQSWLSKKWGKLKYDVKPDWDKETLTLYDDFWGVKKLRTQVTSIEQKACK
jgi:hypothetical protein